MYGQVGQQYLFLSPSGILNPIVGLFFVTYAFFMGRSRFRCRSRGAELEWQAHCKLSNRYAMLVETTDWRWRKSSQRVGGIANYCEILKLYKLLLQWENEQCSQMHLHFMQLSFDKEKTQKTKLKKSKETKTKQVPLRLSPWQLSISERGKNAAEKNSLPSFLDEKVFCFPPKEALIVPGFQLAEQVIL